jgi:deoxyribonuclease (pyrimidine dimer)
MVRINLVSPEKLADQHLIAEYKEILMLAGYVRKFPSLDGIPNSYRLGEGHIKFFKNKLKYLKKRHKSIVMEMKVRGFQVNCEMDLRGFGFSYKKDWVPLAKDIDLIKERLIWKLKQKKKWYRYFGEVKESKFFAELLD